MSDRLVKIITTFFYIGYFPFGPGSLASLAGLGIYAVLKDNPFLYLVLFCFITFFGFRASDRMEKITGQKDPSCIVIDEVSGVMIAFFGLPLTPAIAITAFFLFRAFDMFKIYPVNKFEEIKGGVGVMMDDIFAGFYTCLIMHIAIRIAGVI